MPTCAATRVNYGPSVSQSRTSVSSAPSRAHRSRPKWPTDGPETSPDDEWRARATEPAVDDATASPGVSAGSSPRGELTVLEPMQSRLREMTKLAALTLMSQGQIHTLRREHVHLEAEVPLLPQTKTEPRPGAPRLRTPPTRRGSFTGDANAGKRCNPSPSGRSTSKRWRMRWRKACSECARPMGQTMIAWQR
jgi:hypothetical protein